MTLLAWVDVETTGLDPNKDALLEVACLVTNTDLEILDERGFERVVLYSPDTAQELRDHAVPYVQDMHDCTGLWDHLPFGTPLHEIDQQMHSYLSDFSAKPRVLRLAGNSVRLDLNFLEAQLPLTYSHLHYRSVDVTAVNSVVSWWGRPVQDHKKKEHTAMSDIRESIEELRSIREVLSL